MKLNQILAPISVALCAAAGVQAAPAPKVPALFGGVHITAPGSATVAVEDVVRGGKKVMSAGDSILKGKPGRPVLLVSPAMRISATRMLFSGPRARLHFTGGGQMAGGKFQNGPRAQVKLTLTPRSGGASVQIEAECYVGDIVPGKVTLEDTVSGFYEDATGRHELKGDIVTLSSFDNAISIVQDGDITLSATTAAP